MRRTTHCLPRDRLGIHVPIALALLEELHDDRERRPARDGPADADERDEDDGLPDAAHGERREREEREERERARPDVAQEEGQARERPRARDGGGGAGGREETRVAPREAREERAGGDGDCVGCG